MSYTRQDYDEYVDLLSKLNPAKTALVKRVAEVYIQIHHKLLSYTRESNWWTVWLVKACKKTLGIESDWKVDEIDVVIEDGTIRIESEVCSHGETDELIYIIDDISILFSDENLDAWIEKKKSEYDAKLLEEQQRINQLEEKKKAEKEAYEFAEYQRLKVKFEVN